MQKRQLRPTVVGAGLVALDVVIDHTSADTEVGYFGGGTCGNVLTILSFLGWDSKPIARLGTGASTKFLLEDLGRWGVDLRYLSQGSDGSTPVIIQNIRRLADGTRTHSFSLRCPCCNAYLPGYKSILGQSASQLSQQLPPHQVFFLDRVSRGTLNLAKSSSQLGAIVVFEPSGIGDPKLFKEAWSMANIIKYSTDRIRDLSDLQLGPEDNRSLLIEIQTMGKEGLKYRAGHSKSWKTLKGIPVADFRDAAGSGDWCTAGIIQKLAKGGLKGIRNATSQQIEESLRYGQALATWNCSFDAARGGMYLLTKQKIERQVKQLLSGKAVRLREETADAPTKELSHLCPSCDSTKFVKGLRKQGA